MEKTQQQLTNTAPDQDHSSHIDSTDLSEIYQIYTNIKVRKFHQIEQIEEVLLPLLSEHPELNRVLDIVRAWKPQLEPEEGK